MSGRRAFLAGLAGLFAATSAAAQVTSPTATTEECYVPAELRGVHASLPNTAEAVGKGRELVIVALGSSSTAGTGASRPDKAYPAQLQVALRRVWPTLAIVVYNEGVGGETTEKMLARLERSVLAHQPHLVIWQIGSNGLLQDRRAADHDDLLRQGIARIAAAKADVVLMDPQYAPRLLVNSRYRDVIDAIAAVAAETKVGLLQRSAMMQYWLTTGRYGLDELIVADLLHMSDTGYACVAQLLADGVVAATHAPPPVSPASLADTAR